MAKKLNMLHGVSDDQKTPNQHDRAGAARAAIQTAPSFREHAHRTLAPEADAAKLVRMDLAEQYQKAKEDKTQAIFDLDEAKEKLRLMRVMAAAKGQFSSPDQYARAKAAVIHRTNSLQKIDSTLASLRKRIEDRNNTSFPAIFQRTAELMLDPQVFEAVMTEARERHHRVMVSIGARQDNTKAVNP